jgi:tetratricopeptide (TPR) repeat protein
MGGGKNQTKSILNIPSRDLYLIQSWISGKKLDKAEKKSLELISSYEDVNFFLGKIYALKKQDALAIEHFNRFLNIDYGDSRIKSLRNTLEISAVAIIVEKLFKVEDYKGIIALAHKINNSVVLLGSRSDAQDKNANNLIDLSYFYLGASYLMEGDIERGREALLFAKKRTKDKKFLKAINNYLLQVE